MSDKVIYAEFWVTTGDMKWAIAAEVPPAALNAIRRRLSGTLGTAGATVATGERGMSALLALDGISSDGEDIAIKLSRKYRTPAYLLDFDDNLEYEDHACAILKLDGTKRTWVKGDPAAFLASYGITPPECKPVLESPVTSIGVVEDLTLDEACKAIPEWRDQFASNARGVLVKSPAGLLTTHLARAVHRQSYVVFYDREDESFLCSVWHPDQMDIVCFALGTTATAGSARVDSILGETTMDGILRVLDIPRDALIAGGTEAPGAAVPEEPRA